MQAAIQCLLCSSSLDILDNPPFVLKKCNHTFCDKCKINLTKDLENDNDFVNMPCPL